MMKPKNKIHGFLWLILALSIIVASVYLKSLDDNDNTLKTQLPDPSLKVLAKQNGVEIGNHAIFTRIGEPAYNQILTEEFDFVLLDNTPNWHFNGYTLRPTKDTYDYSQLDYLVNYAKQNNMDMQAHHLLWGEQKWLPDWLKNGNFTRQELDIIIDDHIQNVAGRYRGEIKRWTVVNEAFTREKGLYNLRDWWADAYGSQDYIDKAFISARRADPSAKLILNDFGNEAKNDVSDAMYNYIKSAKARGIPVDALGMQMHIDGSNPPTKEDVIWNMRRFAKLGIDVYVTELDVNMEDLKASYSQKAVKQKEIYYDMTRACIESGVCKAFALLGITDKETWYNHIGLKEPMPLIFDEKYRPKPAYYGLREALEK